MDKNLDIDDSVLKWSYTRWDNNAHSKNPKQRQTRLLGQGYPKDSPHNIGCFQSIKAWENASKF